MSTSASREASEPLFRWIWRSYLRTALVPLLLVEVVLVLVYIAANDLARDENARAIHDVAHDELSRLAAREAVVIDKELSGLRSHAQIFAASAGRVLAGPLPLDYPRQAALARHEVAQGGMTIALGKDGGPSIYYSALTRVGDAEHEKMMRAERLGPLMSSIKAFSPLAVQVYFNTHDSMNLLYPAVDPREVFGPDMRIPSYNFYYEADAEHNPSRGAVWTDVYADPAGRGWMASVIAPVYRGDFLEGVAGLDITVATLVKQVLDMKIPWEGYGMLIGKSGTIMALPRDGEVDFALTELTSHDDPKAIVKDVFKPDDFNLFKRTDVGELAARMQEARAGLMDLGLSTGRRVAAWSTVESTGWKLLVVVPEERIYAQSRALSGRLGRFAFYMVGGLVLFYAGFFAWLYSRARGMARRIAEPLARINALVESIGAGAYEQALAPVPVRVRELDETARGVLAMGKRLGERDRELLSAQEDLRAAKEEAERRVVERTRDLQQKNDELGRALTRLEETTGHLIQSEKMAVVGQLVAGVAHEINTPIGAIKASSQTIAESLEETLERLPAVVRALSEEELGQFRRLVQRGAEGREVLSSKEVRERRRALAARLREERVDREDDVAEALVEAGIHGEIGGEIGLLRTERAGAVLEALSGLAMIERNSRTIQDAVSRVSKAVYSLKTFIHRGELGEQVEVDVTEGIENVLTIYRSYLRQGVDVTRRYGETRRIMCHPDALQQVWTNLVHNAIQAMSGKGRLEIETGMQGERVVVRVIDSGPGIPEGVLARIWEPFFTTKPPGEGTGMGLHIVRTIVERHGGSIDVETRPGRTAFVVSLPALSAREASR